MTDESITLENETIGKNDFAYFVKRVEVKKENYVIAELVDGHYLLKDIANNITFGVVDGDKKDEAIRRVKERAENHLELTIAISKNKGISF